MTNATRVENNYSMEGHCRGSGHCLISEVSKSYRYGFYLDPQPGDPVVVDLNEAEKSARKLSVENGGVPVAIWDHADRILRLFAGYEDFIPIEDPCIKSMKRMDRCLNYSFSNILSEKRCE